MPGVIMENGSRNGSHTNHDRDPRPNGVNGGSYASEKSQDKGKTRTEPQQNITPTSPFAPNGLNNNFTGDAPRQVAEENTTAQQNQDHSFQLPPELNHITFRYIGLKDFLTRMTEKTHADLVDTIVELSQMPLPASAMNGGLSGMMEDNSPENVNKKVRLLQFLEPAHALMTKCLIVAGWSRKAEEVGRVIDLNVHLNTLKRLYLDILSSLGNHKRELMSARLVNPDLKTALEILSTGRASWMPDLGYIQPPPLTSKEILKSLEKLNTLLSIRLNLNDYDSIPIHFKDYTIQSGRVTFKVDGEYEVDLTIAEEDPSAQYWFIDFRFLFKPSTIELMHNSRAHIENMVNGALLKDGLPGCYKYLHELVLTHKISEFRRQAVNLARGKWVETLRVEPLNRSLSIQYWRNKHGMPSPTRSWIIMGVGSPRRKTAGPKSKATSHLFIRWFREGKEIENLDVPFDTVNISTQRLLKTIIAKHVMYILESVHDELRKAPLFAKRELGISSFISLTEPAESFLDVELTSNQSIRVQIEPITGRFVLSPASPMVTFWEHRLNRECKDLAHEAHIFIQNLRYALIDEAASSHGMTVGWIRMRNPLRLKNTLKEGLAKMYASSLPKNHSSVMWFSRRAWSKDWYLAGFPSMSGEHWLLIRFASAPGALDNPSNQRSGNNARNIIPADPKITTYIKLPISTASPTPSYDFMSSLNTFAAGIISNYANTSALHSRRCNFMQRQIDPSRAITIPSIYMLVEDILPLSKKDGREWAKNAMRLTFQGIEVIPQTKAAVYNDSNGPSTPSTQLQVSQTSGPVIQQIGSQGLRRLTQREENSFMVIEARMILPKAKSIESINEKVDADIAFNSRTGSFAFRLRCRVGEAVIDKLVEVAVRVERLVDFAKVLGKHEQSGFLKCGTVSLGRITFTYGNTPPSVDVDSMDLDHEARGYQATIDFSSTESTMALILERGNPHIRILDYLQKVLNSTEGLNGVATLLAQTLPVNRGLDSIERNWPLPNGPENEMFVNVRATDCYIIRYSIRQLPANDSRTEPARRTYMFRVGLRMRGEEPWWWVQRTDRDSRRRESDALDQALKPLWTSRGAAWLGMRVCGVAQKDGIQQLLEKLDETMRTFATSEETVVVLAASAAQHQPTIIPQAPTPAQPTAPISQPLRQHVQSNPQRQQMLQQQQQQQRQQQQQQLHTPNQSQSQSQGRSQPVNREVVEID